MSLGPGTYQEAGSAGLHGSRTPREESVGGGLPGPHGPHLLCHPDHAFPLQCQPQAGSGLPCRLAPHLGHVSEDPALQLLQLGFHVLSLEEPAARPPAAEKELADPGRELRLHLATEGRSLRLMGTVAQARVVPGWRGWGGKRA